MRRFLVALVVVFTSAGTAEAQLNCGVVRNFNASWQPPDLKYVEYIVQTRRDHILCPLEVQAEGWVSGLGGATKHRATYLAEVHVWQPVPYFKTYQINGKHWVIWWLTQWYYNGSTATFATVAYTDSMRCADKGGYWDGGQCYLPNCPIVVDTADDGYRLTGVDEGVRFDLDADGQPELVAWTEADSNDCWLAMDRNGNGLIDNGSELFGNKTPAYADRADPTAADGFNALGFLEGPTYGRSYADGMVDAKDAAFGRLLLWCDTNHNGVSESTELRPAADAGYVSFGTDARTIGKKDRFGNLFRLKGTATGSSGEQTIWDVYLKAKSD